MKSNINSNINTISYTSMAPTTPATPGTSNANASSSSIRVNPARSVGVRINKALEDGEEENLDIKPE